MVESDDSGLAEKAVDAIFIRSRCVGRKSVVSDAFFLRQFCTDNLFPELFAALSVQTQEMSFEVLLIAFRHSGNKEPRVTGNVDMIFEHDGTGSPWSRHGTLPCNVLRFRPFNRQTLCRADTLPIRTAKRRPIVRLARRCQQQCRLCNARHRQDEYGTTDRDENKDTSKENSNHV